MSQAKSGNLDDQVEALEKEAKRARRGGDRRQERRFLEQIEELRKAQRARGKRVG